MSYQGEVLTACGVLNLDFSRTYVVAVSGSGPNACGHLLLYVDSGGGYYLHVAGLHDYPRYITEAGFKRYMKEEGKTVLRRVQVTIPNPDAAYLYLEERLSDTYLWLVLPHNCVTFVEDVIAAGGGKWASSSNCPSLATLPTIERSIKDFLMRLDGQVRQLYGVPAGF